MSVAKGDNDQYRNIDYLAQRKLYEVISWKFLDTKRGDKIVLCELKDPINEQKITIFMPDRFSKQVTTKEKLQELNETFFYLKYMGRDPERRNMALFDLIPMVDICSQEKLLK